MAVGANINYSSQGPLFTRFMELMGRKAQTRKSRTVQPKFCYKAGAPANNTAADNPNALGDVCIDTTNSDVYVCTAFSADASATTWTKIT